MKSKCYSSKFPKTIDRAIKLMKAKGWSVGDCSKASGHTCIRFVKNEDLEKYQSMSEERKKGAVKVTSYEP